MRKTEKTSGGGFHVVAVTLVIIGGLTLGMVHNSSTFADRNDNPPSVIINANEFVIPRNTLNMNRQQLEELGLSVNESGQTYGMAMGLSFLDYPDLIGVTATVGEDGYVLFDDMYTEECFVSPSERLERIEAGLIDPNPYGVRIVPVYKSDGVTIVGEFHIGAAPNDS
jgi:hypothetical protein